MVILVARIWFCGEISKGYQEPSCRSPIEMKRWRFTQAWEKDETNDMFPDEKVLAASHYLIPWLANFANYLANDLVPRICRFTKRRKFMYDVKISFRMSRTCIIIVQIWLFVIVCLRLRCWLFLRHVTHHQLVGIRVVFKLRTRFAVWILLANLSQRLSWFYHVLWLLPKRRWGFKEGRISYEPNFGNWVIWCLGHSL